MKIPSIHSISEIEFENAAGVYKIIEHEVNHNFFYFELNNSKYYIGYFSPVVKVAFLLLEKENYLLIGVDLRVVALCIKKGSVVFSIGLFDFFKGFENTNELIFSIFSELTHYKINKNGLSISEIIPLTLEF